MGKRVQTKELRRGETDEENENEKFGAGAGAGHWHGCDLHGTILTIC